MALAAVKYFGNNLEQMNCTQQFLELLYHNDHNSYAFLNMKTANKMKQKACLDKCNLIPSDTHTDTWVSLNLYASGKSRTAANVREINGFYFDLDKHDGTSAQIKRAILKTYNKILELVNTKVLPAPTAITNTGRGLGLYYIFSRSLAVTENTEKQRKLYSYLYSKVADILQYYMQDKNLLEVDMVVVNDLARIVRLPGTYNTAAKTYCTLPYIGTDYFGNVHFYELSDFKGYIKKYESECIMPTVKKEAVKMQLISFSGCTSTFLYNRLQQITKLQTYFNAACTNNRREYMCFVYYNTAKQIYANAKELLFEFNGKFISPLSDQEVEHVITSVDRNVAETHRGYYKLPDVWIIEKLKLTQEELKVTMLGQTQRTLQREAAKEATKEKRNTRNTKVLNMLSENIYTYKQIATIMEISLSTVKRIAREYGYTRKSENNCTNANKENVNCTLKYCYILLLLSTIIEMAVFMLQKNLIVFSEVHFLALCLCCALLSTLLLCLLLGLGFYFTGLSPPF